MQGRRTRGTGGAITPSLILAGIQGNKLYFFTKIVLTYCEKKLFEKK